jgi:Uncharacterised nucleotidyltransferase
VVGQSKPPDPLALLLCALEEPEVALERWHSLLTEHPLDNFDFAEQRMLPAVLMNTKKATGTIAEESRLRGVSRYTWAKNAKLHKVCREVVVRFQAADIESIVLKGVYFNSVIHKNLGVRPATDFDLLVRWSQAQKALDLLLLDGWRVKGDWVEPQHRLENAVSLSKDQTELDLHWSLLREARKPDLDHIFWNRAVPFELGTVKTETLCPTHHLFHLLVVANREPENLIRYLYDLAILLERHAGHLDFGEIEAMLKERYLLSRVSSLPLPRVGWGHLVPTSKPGLLDRLWSEASRLFASHEGEWNYLLFPFLDYWINFRHFSTPDWSFLTYLSRRLEIKSFGDFTTRSFHKMKRLF